MKQCNCVIADIRPASAEIYVDRVLPSSNRFNLIEEVKVCMRAFILAAGYSTRLWPLTVDRAKPAMPFLGRPLVGYVAEYLARYGYQDVLVNLHHQGDTVRRALGDGSSYGVQLRYVEEPEILGTSGAWDNARSLLEDEPFLAINGKIVTDIDLDAALRTHRERKALATLVLRANTSRERFSTVEVLDGFIKGFGGMPPPAASDNAGAVPLMFTGIQILDPGIFKYIPRASFSQSTTDVYPHAIARGERVAAHLAEGAWHELSTIPRYLDVTLRFLQGAGQDLIVGRDTMIEPGATVRDSVLWNDVRIRDEAYVRRAVIGDGVVLAQGARLENAAVVRAELVRGHEPPPKALEGYFQGDHFIVPFPQ